MVRPPARLDKLSFTARETARPRILTSANRELALIPKDEATTIKVTNHSKMLAVERMKVCKLRSIWVSLSKLRSKIFSRIAFTTRQSTNNRMAKKMVRRADSHPLWKRYSNWFERCPPRLPCQWWCQYS